MSSKPNIFHEQTDFVKQKRANAKPRGYKKSQYCRNGHDKLIAGVDNGGWCRICKSNSPSNTKLYIRLSNLKVKYNLTEEQYNMLLESQDYRCAICQKFVGDDDDAYKLSVDHDHECCPGDRVMCGGTCIRGLLCNPCNRGLGYFKDNVGRLDAAIRYLTQ